MSGYVMKMMDQHLAETLAKIEEPTVQAMVLTLLLRADAKYAMTLTFRRWAKNNTPLVVRLGKEGNNLFKKVEY